MVEIEVKLYGVNKIARRELNKPDEIKEAWLFETKTKKGKWPNKLSGINEVGEWVIEIDKEHECFKGQKTELEKELGTPEPEQSIYKLEFDNDVGIILGIDDKPISDKNKRRFWKGGNVKFNKVKSEDDGDEEHDQPPTTPTDTNYRYCFNCDKWLSKDKVNFVDWGEQPGGEMGQCWYCSSCRKQLGDDSQIQIFRCKKHHDEILKVWGIIDGKNQEKVFYSSCPQGQKEQEPSKGLSGGVIAVISVAILALIGGGVWYWWKQRKERKAEEAEL